MNDRLSATGLKAAFDNTQTACSAQLHEFSRIYELWAGEPPYADSELQAAGRGEASNINTRGFKLNVTNKLNRWKGLAAATKPQVKISFKKYDAMADQIGDAERLAHIITDEALLHPEFLAVRFARYLDVIRYGTGVLAFDDDDAIFPRHIERSTILVPLDAGADPAGWDKAFFRSTRSVARLYEIQKNDVAGYDKTAIRILLANYADGFKAKTVEQAYSIGDWEARAVSFEQGLRDGAYEAATIPVIVGYYADPKTNTVTRRIVADTTLSLIDKDGKITGATAMAQGENLLCEVEVKGAKTLADVFQVMRYSEEETSFWRQQGFGHDAYDLQVAQLRAENNALDQNDMRKPVLERSDALDGVQGDIVVSQVITPPAGAKINSELLKIDPTTAMFMSARLGQQAEAMATATPPPSALEQSSKQPISAAEARERMSNASEQSEAEAALVYRQDDALLRAVTLRVLKQRVTSELTRHSEVYDNVKARVSDELAYPAAVRPNNLRVQILPGVGSGSAQDRQQRKTVAFQNRGALDPIGRQRMVKDYYSEVVGSDRVDRYVIEPDPRQVPVVASHQARNENLFFEMGKNPVPAADDIHLLHAQIHLTFLAERAQAVAQAEQNQQIFDAAPLAVTFEAAMPHIAYHVDQVQAAATTEELQAEAKGLFSMMTQMLALGQRLKANAQAQAQEAQKQQQQAMQQAQMQQQELLKRIDAQALQIQKMQTDHTIAYEKFQAAQRVREQESNDKIARANRELEAKIRALENKG
jgi:hypothetical protein